LKDLGNVSFPLGWSRVKDPNNPNGPMLSPFKDLADPLKALTKIIGVLITALAISVGSSIWFDILNRVINLRNTGVKPQSSSQ
jgi:hypothetical protein